MEEVYFNKEGRNQLIEGINKLNKAVASTMGPMGNTVVIPDKDNPGKYKVTKDGVSVANSIRFKNPVEDIGAELIKQAANKQLKEVGDATTTTTVLATAFVNNLKDFNSKDINKAFDEIIPKVIKELKDNSRQLKHEDIKYVATISANNDIQIGDIIQQGYDFSNIIKIEESNNHTDTLECVEGMSLNTTYFSKNFITNPRKGEVELDRPYILIIDGKIENLNCFENIIKDIHDKGESLLIITEHINENLLRLVETNVLSHSLKCCIIKSPGFSKHRQDLLQDISLYSAGTLIIDLNKNYSKSILGRLKSAKITKDRSILLKDESVNLDSKINDMKEFSKQLEDYDRELIEQRISNLTGKVSIIKVGGRSEIEMKERKDRYDDAISAVACALEEGIIEGGGIALYNASGNLCNSNLGSIIDSIFKALDLPSNILMNTNDINYEEKNMFDLNIIDPLKSIRCALENAVSVAKTILSTEAIVLNYTEWIKQ